MAFLMPLWVAAQQWGSKGQNCFLVSYRIDSSPAWRKGGQAPLNPCVLHDDTVVKGVQPPPVMDS